MALLKVLLLLELGVLVNSAVSLQKRIIGGQNCDDTERLYHVRVESSRGDRMHRCGGSLIHPQWILTAAQCWKSETGWTNRVTLKVHPRTAGQQNQVIRQAPVIYSHFGQQHNIMLLKLDTPVTDVPLGRLPDCRYRLHRDDFLQLAGEGATTTGPNCRPIITAATPAHLQCVDMKVIQVSSIIPSYGNEFHAEAPYVDICFGDTGGAAVYNNMIYGVISYGGPEYAYQRPATIMDVCDYLGWIKYKLS